jgi:hypothetical protein
MDVSIRSTLRYGAISVFGAIALGLLAAASDPVDGEQGIPPIKATPLVPLENTMWLYKDSDFRGNETWVHIDPQAMAPHKSHRLKSGIHDDLSSLRWNLADGIVVVLYQDSNGEGSQIAIWGRGQFDSLGRFNDKATSWSWFRIGEKESKTLDDPLRATEPTQTVDVGTVRLFQDSKMKKEKGSLRRITDAYEPGKIHELDKDIRGKLTSLRWHLSGGVVVVFYESTKGKGRQLAIWGSGEYDTVKIWDFGDRAEGWAWFPVS